MSSFVKAQLGARMMPGDVCVALPNDHRLIIPPWMKGAAHYIYPTLVEFEEMSFVMHFLRSEDKFADVGANLGAFTVMASGVGGAQCIAFEPAPFAFSFLSRNIALNNLSSLVSLKKVALGSKVGRIYFTADLGTENHVCSAEDPIHKVEVEVSTLDTQLAQFHPTLIKIDVEGFEDEVMAGGRQVFERASLEAVIIERAGNAARYGKDEAGVHEYLRACSFIPCLYEPATRSLRAVPKDTAGGNLIYVRNVDRVNQKLRSAPGYRFAGQTV